MGFTQNRKYENGGRAKIHKKFSKIIYRVVEGANENRFRGLKHKVTPNLHPYTNSAQ